MRRKQRIRIILDTNIWISYLISHHLQFIDDLIIGNKVALVYSDELIEEFIEVARRPRLKKYFSDDDLMELLDLLKWYGIMTIPQSQLNLCRDPKDNFLLNLAVDAKADYLVTGDDDLLDLKTVDHCKIISLSTFTKIASEI